MKTQIKFNRHSLIRLATVTLMYQPIRHRLLLMGSPNV